MNKDNFQNECDEDFISYIVDFFKSFESGRIGTNAIVSNLSAAIVMHLMLMECCGFEFREESAAKLNNPETCSAIHKLTSNLCIVHFKGKT